MTNKYEALRAALAAGPTPGPWSACGSAGYIQAGEGHPRHTILAVAYGHDGNHQFNAPGSRENGKYIAAAHPETIRALLAERDALVDTANDQARANDLLSEREAGLLAQHERDSATLRRYAQQRDDLRKERDALRDALQAMVDDFDGCYAENEPAMIKARAALAQHQGENNVD